MERKPANPSFATLPSAPKSSEATAEWNTLTAAPNDWGVLHVAPTAYPETDASATTTRLFSGLFSSADPRLHQATVLLLLTHPHLAPDAQAAIEELINDARYRAMLRLVAAAAMQRMARTRITLRLGPQPLIPPAYLDVLNLPSLDEEFGRATLYVLSGQEQDRYGYNAWGTYVTLLDLFSAEIRCRNWGNRAPTD